MLNFFDKSYWAKPEICIDSEIGVFAQHGSGFLTPTPLSLPNGVIRLFGGIRDSQGRSRIYYIDLDSHSLKIIPNTLSLCLDTRNDENFAKDGAILGDLVHLDGALMMFYIGFNKGGKSKFRAFTGQAISLDFGETWEKCTQPFSEIQAGLNTDIFAVHNLNYVNNKFSVLVAVGDGWESINNSTYPRYRCYEMIGSNLDNLELSKKPILPQQENLYRLGRPRFMRDNFGNEIIIATGGERSGDYRPYIFEKKNGKWILSNSNFPVLPGDYKSFTKQVSYPSHVKSNDRDIFFFNGDNMGEKGCFFILKNNSENLNI